MAYYAHLIEKAAIETIAGCCFHTITTKVQYVTAKLMFTICPVSI